MSGGDTEMRIEQQLTLLLRRVQHMHGMTSPDGVELDRSGYGILSRIADSGPQRLSDLAQAFGLDPSTITRQVQALEGSGLVTRSRDPQDRRASLLALTQAGHTVLGSTRSLRIERLREAMAAWTQDERHTFGRLLADFNEAVGRTVARAVAEVAEAVDPAHTQVADAAEGA
jgi:DNA-binding MarR family transcriptional regulator